VCAGDFRRTSERVSAKSKQLCARAGYLLFNLVNLHPFLDGNKRTAFEVAKTFLDLNGWSFDPPEEEAFSTLKSVSSGAVDAQSTEDWVGRNLSRRRSKR
jgi:death on curing protein